MLLAAFGIYGTVTSAVALRRRELGVRLALGASQANVLMRAAGCGATPTLIGLAAGVPLALAAGRMLRDQLYGIAPTDWSTMVHGRRLHGGRRARRRARACRAGDAASIRRSCSSTKPAREDKRVVSRLRPAFSLRSAGGIAWRFPGEGEQNISRGERGRICNQRALQGRLVALAQRFLLLLTQSTDRRVPG